MTAERTKADADRLSLLILQARLQGEIAARSMAAEPGAKRLLTRAAEQYGWANGAPDGTHPNISAELKAAFIRGVKFQEAR